MTNPVVKIGPRITARELRNKICSHFFGSSSSKNKKLELTYNQLMSDCGNILKPAKTLDDAVSALEDFHLRHQLRTVDLYKRSADSMLVAAQLADVRKTLAVQAFRLAAKEYPGNYALALGGSVVKGDHTFLTDVDAIVISAADEDRAAAQNVQELMRNILLSLHIEMDDVMPFHFASNPFSGLEKKFVIMKRSELTGPFLNSMWISNGSYSRFLTDLKVVEARGSKKFGEFTGELDALRNKTVYDCHEAMLDLCWSTFNEPGAGEKNGFDIKNNALRPFYYALYAARACLKIKSPSPWAALDELKDKGVIDSEEASSAKEAINYLLSMRHLIGMAYINAKDSKKLSDEALVVVSFASGEGKEKILEKAKGAGKLLLELSERIFKKLR